jgi:hypothetical protein
MIKPIKAERVPVVFPAERCCAPGCGDKIKDGPLMWRITWDDGDVSYLEDGCVDWFVNGHPDYGGKFGPVMGLR